MIIVDKIKRELYTGLRNKALILMYHRIHETDFDPWDLCVSLTHFREHLEMLSNHYDIYPLSSLNNGFSSQKENKRKKIFITFDDGYLDNYEKAVPLLSKFGLRATFFIPTLILNEKKHFWWELVDYIFNQNPEFPEEFNLYGLKNTFTKRLSSEICFPNKVIDNEWSANSMPPPDERCRFYLELCNWIKERMANEQEMITAQLMEKFNIDQNHDIGFNKMLTEQIAALPNKGFELGAHTVRHPALSFQPVEVQQQEIALSKKQLEDLTGNKITAFAYPHGQYTPYSKNIVRETGFNLACTTENKAITNHADLFALPRAWVYNCNGAKLKQQINNLFKGHF